MARTTTIGTRLDAALQHSAAGPAVDPTRDLVDSGAAETQVPRDYGSEFEAWLGRAERLVEGIVDAIKGARPRTTKTVSELKEVIRTYEGRDTVYVAFYEGCSVRTVERARADLGLQPSTGFREPKLLKANVAIYEADGIGQDSSRQDGIVCVRSQTALSGASDV